MANLKVTLINPLGSTSPRPHEAICVSRRSDGETQKLEISLRRTIRVPDNGDVYELPPDMGAFPIYNVREYDSKLPLALVEKGGVFIPMFQREAMWISFNCQQPFAIKVFVGGINVVTGESKRKTPEMVKCQQERFANNESMQDYVVPPDQLWLDGIATMDGKVMQFIATPVGTGYSVEAQVTGEDKIAGVQFEITPKLPDPYHTMAPFSTETPDQLIYIRHLTSTSLPLRVALSYTVDQVKTLVEERVKLAVRDQRLTYHGIQLEGDRTLFSYDISEYDTLSVFLRLRGGGAAVSIPDRAADEMSLGAGGFIEQVIHRDEWSYDCWDRDKTILFNLQLLDATCFKHIVCIDPPDTPITAVTYAEHGYPFYKLYEQPSGIFRDFHLKSVGALDKKLGSNFTDHQEEQNLAFPSEDITEYRCSAVTLNTVDTKTEFIPIQELEIRFKKGSQE